MNWDGPLGPEDYQDPRCPLCEKGFGLDEPVSSIPQQRISEKLDEYMSAKDFAGAERHLRYWMEEARAGRDRRGEFFLYNEMMGFYRKVRKLEEGVDAARRAVAMLPSLGYDASVSGGTCYVNAGTVYSSFRMDQESLSMFEKARAIYEKELPPGDARLGGLYNNMGLALAALSRFSEARDLFAKALSVMGKVKNGELECAVTYLNLADCAAAEKGEEAAEEEISGFLEKAEELLFTETLPLDGYTAFFFEKCAPVFDAYGWFLTARRLEEKAGAFYKEARS